MLHLSPRQRGFARPRSRRGLLIDSRLGLLVPLILPLHGALGEGSCEGVGPGSLSLLQSKAVAARRSDHTAAGSLRCSNAERLLFLHIPKTAGSAIEDAALQLGIHWGSNMDFEGCGKPQLQCPMWHVPPAWLPPPTIYSGKEVFCVVRNPFDRAVSEYRYKVADREPAGKYYDGLVEEYGCSAEGLNRYLENLMVWLEAGVRDAQACHLNKQTDYVWGPVEAGSERRRQWCDHVLRYEELPDAFNNLMARKGYSVRLSEQRVNAGNCSELTPKDLKPRVADLLRLVYHDDFQMLNYSMELPG